MTTVDVNASPTKAERAYAFCVAILVPIFFVATWLGGSIQAGVVNYSAIKSDIRNALELVGVISIALATGNRLLGRFTGGIQNRFAREFVRFGLPLFLLLSFYNWAFPGAIRLSEHLMMNLFFALLLSLSLWGNRAEQ